MTSTEGDQRQLRICKQEKQPSRWDLQLSGSPSDGSRLLACAKEHDVDHLVGCTGEGMVQAADRLGGCGPTQSIGVAFSEGSLPKLQVNRSGLSRLEKENRHRDEEQKSRQQGSSNPCDIGSSEDSIPFVVQD
jgi:hypothetical protein